MIYVMYGTEDFFIWREIEALKKKYQIHDINISRYDMEQTTMDTILEDANTFSLFAPIKMILVDRASIFANSPKKTVSDDDLIALEDYMKHMNPDTHLIFIHDKVNKAKKITKLVKKYGVLKECNHGGNLNGFVKELLTGYQLEPRVIPLLLERVGENVALLQKECEKLKLCKWEEKAIATSDVEALVHKTITLDIFHFIDTIIQRKKEEAIEIYREMLKYNEEPIKIVVMLSNQFRLMYQAKELIRQGYRESDIATKLGAHPYSVKLALQKSRAYESNYLLSILEQLADLDYQIKSGQVEKELALELFILEL